MCNMTTFRKKKIIWPFDPTPVVIGVCNDSIFAFMVLCDQFPLIWYRTWLLSQKYMVLPFDPTPWAEGVSVGKIFATMLLQNLSALILYATWPYSEKFNFGLRPTPEVHPRGSDPCLQTKILFDMFHIYCCSAYMQNFSKKYWQLP